MKPKFTKLMLPSLVTVLLLAVAIASSVGAQEPEGWALFGHDNVNHTIVEIDTTTGLATVVGPTNFDSGMAALARASQPVPSPGGVPFAAGTLFGLLRDDTLGADFVVVVDVTSGTAEKVVETDRQIEGRGIAFGPDGRLFVVEGPGGKLSTVDTVTGAVELVGDTGFSVPALEWDPDSASFLAIAAIKGVEIPNLLIRIDPSDASSEVVGSAGALVEPPDQEFLGCTLARSPGGVWYTININSSNLVTVDVETGTVGGVVGGLGDAASVAICGTIFAPSALADLAVTKTDSPDPVLAGASLTYTLAVTNNGPTDATGVTVTDTLPASVTFDSATPSQGSCNEAGGTVTCDLGDLAVGGTASVEIAVTVDPSTAHGATLTNSAEVMGSEPDPDLGNNTATEDTEVIRQADLSIVKTDDPDPVDGGALLTYTLSVGNAGPNTAEAVVVADTLPTSVTFESAGGDGWECGEAAGVVTCTRDSLPVGDAPPIIITVTAPTPDSDMDITNSATIGSDTPDPNPDNNADSEPSRVVVPPPGTDKLTARVFIDFRCNGYFQGGLDVPLGGVPVTIKFLVNGARWTLHSTSFGMVYFGGIDVSGGLDVSVSLPASYLGFPLDSCFNSPTTVRITGSDFDGVIIKHKHIDFRADVVN